MLSERKCNCCGKTCNEADMYVIDNKYYCRNCVGVCEECGALEFIDELTWVNLSCDDQKLVCDSCIGSSKFFYCSECEKYYSMIYHFGSYQSNQLCVNCSDKYGYCDRCNYIYPSRELVYNERTDEYLCEECEHEANNEHFYIHDYYYKPEPVFYGSGSLFIGVEVEVDNGTESEENAEAILSVANADSEHIFIKHDGSLEDGFEMVSHPMTLCYHTNNMNWEDVFNKAISLGFRGHQTNTAGIHCHVNRNAFGETQEEQEEVIARIVFFIENHWNELFKFSRRTVENMNRWSSRYGISENTKSTYKKAKDSCNGRYVALNLSNTHTLEFRLFRSSLKYSTFMAILQLVDEICNTAMLLSDAKIESLSWSDFVLKIDKTDKPELISYLKSKQLYVNEIKNETEEM